MKVNRTVQCSNCGRVLRGDPLDRNAMLVAELCAECTEIYIGDSGPVEEIRFQIPAELEVWNG